MRPRKTRFLVRGGEFLADGRPVPIEPSLLALVLTAEGYPDIEQAVISEETAHRLLRIRSSILLVRKLEHLGLIPESWVGLVDGPGESPEREPVTEDPTSRMALAAPADHVS